MNKNRTISGAILLIILAVLLIFSIVDIAKMPGVVQTNPLFSPGMLKLVAWAVLVYTLCFMIGITWAISKEQKIITQWSRLLTVHADIPGYFFASFIPVVSGTFLIIIGQIQLGVGLACLSLPSIVVFLLIELLLRRSGD